MKQNKRIRARREKKPDFLYLMGENGWEWQTYQGWADDGYYKSKSTFLGIYRVEIFAVVADNWKHISEIGHLGIMWLEVAGYPDCGRDENHGYSYSDLQDMIDGLIIAEENLVRCGIPFTPDYEFHSPNKANLKRRNDAIRKRLNMEHWEEIAWEEANK